jgi:hypothetical protein
MPQVPTTPDNRPPVLNHTPPPAENTPRPLLVPPEEQFWKRYSPHHEFSLSSATSAALHILGIGLLLLIAYVIWSNRPQKPSDVPQMDVVLPDSAGLMDQGAPRVAQDGGGRGGVGGTGTKGRQEDVREDEKKDVDSGNPDDERLKDPPVPPPPIPDRSAALTKDGTRTIVDGDVPKELSRMAKKSYRVLAQRAPRKKSKGSKDGGGGAGGDKGRGRDSKSRDNGRGEGKGQLEQQRARRQLRWRVVFSTSSGRDYQDQLSALRAILVIGEFELVNGAPVRDEQGNARLKYEKVIRHLSNSPARVSIENVRTIPGIFWIDDKRESVAALAQSLGLPGPLPPLIAAFFPRNVEEELRYLERKKYGGPENKIDSTVFRVVPSPSGKYRGNRTRYKLICQQVMLINHKVIR